MSIFVGGAVPVPAAGDVLIGTFLNAGGVSIFAGGAPPTPGTDDLLLQAVSNVIVAVAGNAIDVSSAAVLASKPWTFANQPRVPSAVPVAKQTVSSAGTSVLQQGVAVAWGLVVKPINTAYISAHSLRVHNFATNDPAVVGGGIGLRYTFIYPMANDDYIVIISAGSSNNAPCIGRVTQRTTLFFDIVIDDWSSGSKIFQNTDFTMAAGSPQIDLNVVVFGDVA
jgi:hypothetical protein